MGACRDINKLHPYVQKLCVAFLEQCKKEGLNIGISETFRSVERQNELYNQGRTAPGDIVTQAKGSDMSSYHQWGLAFDIYNNVPGDLYNLKVLNKAGAIGQKLGLEWGGAWTGFKDRPHFQYTFGLSIKDLKAGKLPKEQEEKEPVKSTYQEKQIDIVLDNTIKRVNVIEKDGLNYIKMRDLECEKIKVSYGAYQDKGKLPILQIK